MQLLAWAFVSGILVTIVAEAVAPLVYGIRTTNKKKEKQ